MSTESAHPPTSVVAVIDDFFFVGKIEAALTGLGLWGARARSAEELDEHLGAGDIRLLIVDIGARSVEPPLAIRKAKAVSPPASVIAYGGHTDIAGLEAAREAGADHVLINSQLAANLAPLIAETVGVAMEGR